MVTALIVINQSGRPAGSPGSSRDDLALGTPVVFSNNDNSGIDTWLWELESRPVGSIASLAGATSSIATLTPDVRGSYLVKLTVDGSGSDLDSDARIAAVKTVKLGMRKPATGETFEFDAIDGWSAALQAALDAIDADAAASLKADGSVQASSIPLSEQVLSPAPASDQGSLYTKNVGGVTALFYLDSSGGLSRLDGYAGVATPTAFIDLTDTPASFAGAGLQLVRVRNDETGLEFFTFTGNSLDQAYDQGQSISADTGAVDITATGGLGALAISRSGGSNSTSSLSIETDAAGFFETSLYINHKINGRNSNFGLNLLLEAGTAGLDAYESAHAFSAILYPAAGEPDTANWYGLNLDCFPAGATDSIATAVAVGANWDYALRAESGSIELAAGDIILTSGDVVLDGGPIRFGEQSVDPSAVADKGFLYAKDVGGITALFYLDNSGGLSRLDGYMGAGNSLDQAYDEGGAGAGRAIDANAGPVYILATGTNGPLHLKRTGPIIDYTDAGLFVETEGAAVWDNGVAVEHYLNGHNGSSAQYVGLYSGTGGLASYNYCYGSLFIIEPSASDGEFATWHGLGIENYNGSATPSRKSAISINDYGDPWDYALYASTGHIQLQNGSLSLDRGGTYRSYVFDSDTETLPFSGRYQDLWDVGGSALTDPVRYLGLSRMDIFSNDGDVSGSNRYGISMYMWPGGESTKTGFYFECEQEDNDGPVFGIDLSIKQAESIYETTGIRVNVRRRIGLSSDYDGYNKAILVEGGDVVFDGGPVRFGEQSSNPPAVADKGFLYAKDTGGVTALFYMDNNGSLSRLDGYSSFTSLNDTPSTYTGSGEYFVKVKADETGLEFIADPGGGGGSALQDGYLLLPEQNNDPTPVDGYGLIYTRNVHDGYSEYHTELFYMDDYGQVTQVTRDGYLATDGYFGTVQVSASLTFEIADGLIVGVIES